MRILVIGNGGREHAIIKKIQEEKHEIFCSPGISALDDEITNFAIPVDNIQELLEIAATELIDLTIVGPEMPLVLGIVDLFKLHDRLIFGPDEFAAQLEGSKAFSKMIMEKYGIPTAKSATFDSYVLAKEYLEKQTDFPIVIKASGLAAGKGVVIPSNLVEALQEIDLMMNKKIFGDAAHEIVIEEFMPGDEASVFVITDGKDYVVLPAAQDHKRIGEGDTGKNTGGMGAYAPAPLVNDDVLKNVEQFIIEPLLFGMQEEDHPYRGVLFIGLMIEANMPKVIEFNARFGDPETQVLLPLIKSSFVDLLYYCALKELKNYKLEIHSNKVAMTVVVAAKGYPDSYQKDEQILGLDLITDSSIIYSGIKKVGAKLFSNGGRVLNIVSVKDTIDNCADAIYSDIEKINYSSKYFRKDIAYKIRKK